MWRERIVMRSKTKCFLMHSSVGTTNFSCNFLWLINVKHFFRYFCIHSSHETFVSPLACWQWFFKTLFSDLLSDACIWQPTECGNGAGEGKAAFNFGRRSIRYFYLEVKDWFIAKWKFSRSFSRAYIGEHNFWSLSIAYFMLQSNLLFSPRACSCVS